MTSSLQNAYKKMQSNNKKIKASQHSSMLLDREGKFAPSSARIWCKYSLGKVGLIHLKGNW